MTGAWFNPTTFSPIQAAQLQYTLALQFQANPAALGQLGLINQLYGQDAQLRGGFSPYAPGQAFLGPTGAIPQPRVEFSGAPAGKGLTTNPQGWPQGSVQTAGGYTIVPEGKDAAWSVYGPNAKPGDQPMSRIWGDPHVNEKDGTRWDFTKNSNFRLPDGTNIAVSTTSQTGQSVTAGLDITNGGDRVQISGIDQNKPALGQVTHDGYQARAGLQGDTYHLGGNGTDNVKWFLERDGVMQGEVTGAHYDNKTNRYEQDVNKESKYAVDPSLRPPVGSPAWGNQLRMEAVDVARRTGRPEYAGDIANLMQADHVHGQLVQQLGYDPLSMFGGYGGWGGYPQMTYSVGSLFQTLAQQEVINQLYFNARSGGPIQA
jgi:hypothetical protein